MTTYTQSNGETVTISVERTTNPTPRRGWDWRAITTDYEPGHPVGLGADAEAAVAALIAELEHDLTEGL